MPGSRSWSINSLFFIASSLRDLCVSAVNSFSSVQPKNLSLSRPVGLRIILAPMGILPAQCWPERDAPAPAGGTPALRSWRTFDDRPRHQGYNAGSVRKRERPAG